MANKVSHILEFARNSAFGKDKKGFAIFASYGINKTKKGIALSSERTFCNFSTAYTRDVRQYYGKRNDSAYIS